MREAKSRVRRGNFVTLNYAEVKSIKWPSPMSRAVKTSLLGTAVVASSLLVFLLLGGPHD